MIRKRLILWCFDVLANWIFNLFCFLLTTPASIALFLIFPFVHVVRMLRCASMKLPNILRCWCGSCELSEKSVKYFSMKPFALIFFWLFSLVLANQEERLPNKCEGNDHKVLNVNFFSKQLLSCPLLTISTLQLRNYTGHVT